MHRIAPVTSFVKRRTEGWRWKKGIHWRERREAWPSLTVQLELAPWHWRLGYVIERKMGAFTLLLGPLEIEVWTNKTWR